MAFHDPEMRCAPGRVKLTAHPVAAVDPVLVTVTCACDPPAQELVTAKLAEQPPAGPGGVVTGGVVTGGVVGGVAAGDVVGGDVVGGAGGDAVAVGVGVPVVPVV